MPVMAGGQQRSLASLWWARAHPPGIIVDGNCSGLIIRPRNEIAILRLLDGKDQSFRAYQRNHGAGDY